MQEEDEPQDLFNKLVATQGARGEEVSSNERCVGLCSVADHSHYNVCFGTDYIIKQAGAGPTIVTEVWQ